MSVASEREAVGLILDELRDGVLQLSDTLRKAPLSPGQLRHLDQILELRYALIAVLQASIADGMPAASALASLRDIGAQAWGIKLSVQHAGDVDIRTIGLAAQDLAGVMAEAAGVEAGFVTSVSVPDPALHSTTRH